MSKDIQQQKQYNILLMGEACQDVYVFGEVKRISPEAPVPVLKKIKKEFKKGMAGNVFENIKCMAGDKVKIDFYCNDHSNIKKIRFIDEKSNYQIMRYDIEKEVISLDFDNIKEIDYDVVVISDYNKGYLTDESIRKIIDRFSESQIFVDTKRKDISVFKNCILKLNENESKEARYQNRSTKIITTLGQKGCSYLGKTYSVAKVDVHDICGAGDVFLAALVTRWIETKDIAAAIRTANNCAALSVTKLGCYTINRKEYESFCV